MGVGAEHLTTSASCGHVTHMLRLRPGYSPARHAWRPSQAVPRMQGNKRKKEAGYSQAARQGRRPARPQVQTMWGSVSLSQKTPGLLYDSMLSRWNSQAGTCHLCSCCVWKAVRDAARQTGERTSLLLPTVLLQRAARVPESKVWPPVSHEVWHQKPMAKQGEVLLP